MCVMLPLTIWNLAAFPNTPLVCWIWLRNLGSLLHDKCFSLYNFEHERFSCAQCSATSNFICLRTNIEEDTPKMYLLAQGLKFQTIHSWDICTKVNEWWKLKIAIYKPIFMNLYCGLCTFLTHLVHPSRLSCQIYRWEGPGPITFLVYEFCSKIVS